jgi:hypothetical protein
VTVTVTSHDASEIWNIAETVTYELNIDNSTGDVAVNHPPTVPIPISPADITEIDSESAKLVWQKSSDPNEDVISYAVLLYHILLDKPHLLIFFHYKSHRTQMFLRDLQSPIAIQILIFH